MNKQISNFFQKLSEHTQKYWEYKQNLWKRKEEEIQFQRKQELVQRRKEYLYECALQIRNELSNVWKEHHYGNIQTIHSLNDIKIQSYKSRCLIILSLRLTTANSILEELTSLKNILNQEIKDYRDTLIYKYQYGISDECNYFPYLMDGLKVIHLQQEGLQLFITIQLNTPL